MKTIAVIGSGFGGLAEAIRLQAAGFQVTIFEKREQVGGRAYQLVKDGYTFDMGPSLITAPFIIDAVFQAAGQPHGSPAQSPTSVQGTTSCFHSRSFLY